MLGLRTEIISQKADIETSSEEYAKRFSGDVGEYFLSVQAEKTLDLLKPWPNAKVLDVGGGHAQLAVHLVKNGFALTIAGSDDSCRSRPDKFLQPGSFKYLSCNLLDLPFEDNSFDIVISFRLLTHEDNWKLQIAELCRVAKYAVVVDYPDIRSFNIFYDILFKVKKKFEKNTRTYRNFSRKEIIEEFRKNSFTNPVIKPEFFLPMVVHRAAGKVNLLRNIENIFFILGLTKLFGSPVILRVISGKK
jgi:ubiquinone/menaquinone biosynthesis C-methylase UbiE